ncbi:Icc-related predicted phosphoesterase [Bradyrhizobium sp. AZCC 1577]|uniref:metallophosphoesterase n=1 Tax=Bradyrhizobium sp. AZCC 1577 TaxID=3117019 RepID=UPI002FF17ED0
MTLRINLVSDLHLDIAGNALASMPAVDADVTVVAGDAAAPGTVALRRVRDLYSDRSRPLIYVAGNHDYYSEGNPKILRRHPEMKTTWDAQRRLMPEVARELDIILLDDSAVEIEGVLFIGSTMWTDMSVRPPYMSHAEAVRAAGRTMNDYRCIKTGAGRSRDRLTPGQTVDAHKASVRFIESALADRPADQDAVVVTHMAPSRRSLLGYDPAHPERIREMDWCYAVDLERLMTGDAAPSLWLHGHIHGNRDYTVCNARIVSNPRGYPELGGRRENPDFDPALVIELEPKLSLGMRR